MFKLLTKGTRFAVFTYEEQAAFQNSKTIQYYVNGGLAMETDRVVFGLYDLKPSTHYKVNAVWNEKILATIELDTDYESVTLDVKDFHAKGDGISDDTGFIQAAILSCPKSGRVLIPQGKYKVGPLFLKSDISIEIAKGAVLTAKREAAEFPVLPGYTATYAEDDFITLSSWEGNPLDCYAGIINGISIRNVAIYGQGEINGNSTITDWWDPSIKHREPFRPRSIFLNDCEDIHIIGISIYRSPSWTIHPYRSRFVNIFAVTITNPHNSPNTDGIDPESCQNVTVMGVLFDLGDDCIAIKSGKLFMAEKKYLPSKDIRIEHCYMKNGHGAVTIGSEIASGCHRIVVRKCIFENTDRGLRIKTRRGRGSRSVIDNILFEDIQMRGVKTPFVVNCFYFCDPDGKSDYVQNQGKMPIDYRTPSIRSLQFKNIRCLESRVCAAYIHGLPENPISEVVFEKVQIVMAENQDSDYPAMMLGIEKMNQSNAVFKNIRQLVLKEFNVENSKNEMIIDSVEEILYH